MGDGLEKLVISLIAQAPFAFVFLWIFVKCRVSVDCGNGSGHETE